MQATQSSAQLLKRLWHHISQRRRQQFALLLVLIVFASFAEMVSIGATFSFLGVLTAPESVFQHAATRPILHALGFTAADQLLFPLTLAFATAALLAGATRLLLLWVNTRLSYAAGADLSLSIYRRTLYQPYSVHVMRNSSEVINGISGKTSIVIHIMMMMLNLIGSSVLLLSVLVALLSIDPIIALAAFGAFGLLYTIIIHLARHRLATDSQRIAHESTQVIKSLQEGLGGIRDVLIDGSQDAYCQIYRNADLPLRRAQGNSAFISTSPRYGMEALGMILIAALAYALSRRVDGIASAIPILGTLALGAQRLLPMLQNTYFAWASIQGSRSSLQDALDLLDQPLPAHADQPATEPLKFTSELSLDTVSFRYGADAAWVLRDVSLAIPKGCRMGVIGATGGGKSTLLDIVMGLLNPTEGALKVDGQPVTAANCRAWQLHIAHVPQAIFLADSTIEENIAFGVPKNQIDGERVRHAARQAQIADAIESWPEKYQTFVGERGIRLSGGQRQRIGIARALYKQADVIIFDEATSALDNETEESVMQAIESLSGDLTLLIVAHRLTTLKNCTRIIDLAGGKIARSGSYEDIVAKQPAPGSWPKGQNG